MERLKGVHWDAGVELVVVISSFIKAYVHVGARFHSRKNLLLVLKEQ